MNTGNPLSPSGYKRENPTSLLGAGMGFNLLQLHDPKEDTNVRKFLRLYSVVPRFSRYKTGPRAEQAVRVNKFLRGVNERLNKKIGFAWKDQWLESLGCEYAKQIYKDWFIGRASLPLVALKKLETFGFKSEVDKLIESCDFFSSTSARPFRIPHNIEENLAYLLGAILGDGHITKIADRIAFEVSEKWLAKKFKSKVMVVFAQNLNLRTRFRPDRDTTSYGLLWNNKSAVRLFTKFLSVPRGKKSHIITVSRLIRESNQNIRLAYLEGVFDTEGCIRRKGLRITSASKDFRDGLCDLLISFGEKGYKDEWINKKYNKKYYGLQYSIRNLPFLAGVP
ncbi:MAG: LAGLIDADG family homing endonuclease [archaeon]|nr:LAGLIDADG family homing endonuclease [archaeon]